MKANRGKYEWIAQKCLKKLGATVHCISRDIEKRTPDFIAVLNSSRVIIEVKDKLDDLQKVALREADLQAGRLHANSLSLGYQTTIASKVSEGRKQLEAYGLDGQYFRLIWFNAIGRDSEAKAWQFEATLLGSQKIDERDNPQLRTCYFFDESSFFKHKEVLDGAVLARGNDKSVSLKLIINSLSPNYAKFLGSDFTAAFQNQIVDPKKEEENGHFILGADANRSGEDEKLRYLMNKYKVGPLGLFNLGYQSAEIRLPNQDQAS